MSWTQGQEIELFSDLSGNVQTLLPGAEGSYPFILENNNSFHVIFTLSIEEDSLHIPMRFRIVTYKDRKPLTDWWIHKTAALRKVIPYAWVQVKANPIFWSGSGLMRAERTGLTQMQARQTLIIGSGLKYGLSRKVRRYMHGKRTVL